MMGNKYYTPDLEDLIIGMDVEIFQNNNWDVFKFEDGFGGYDDSIGIAQYFIQNKELRIKYLDKEDIESLGWGFEGGKLRANFLDTFRLGLYTLNYKYDSQSIRIEFHPVIFYESPIYVFQGVVKNKSELIKLMKMLEINGK